MDIPLTEEQYNDYIFTDKCIRDICPELPACEREFLINGNTPQDWEKDFGGCSMGCKPCKYNINQLKR